MCSASQWEYSRLAGFTKTKLLGCPAALGTSAWVGLGAAVFAFLVPRTFNTIEEAREQVGASHELVGVEGLTRSIKLHGNETQ